MKSMVSFAGTLAASAGAFSRFYLAGPRKFMENVRVQTHVMRESCSRCAQEVGRLPILYPQGFMGEEGELVDGSSRDLNPR